MNLLLIAPGYPYATAEWIGPQNEHCAHALKKVARDVVVLTPRPYAPPILRVIARWRAYTEVPRVQLRRGIVVYRPAYPTVPRFFPTFWSTTAAFLFSRSLVRHLHRELRFDAILSFDLASTGGVAWRLARYLGIPACGWATGDDIRWNARTGTGRSVRESLARLDVVFYQSHELKSRGAELLGVTPEGLPAIQHVVQARGVVAPERPSDDGARSAIRAQLGLSDDQVLVLYLGRIVRDKGLFELVDGFRIWTRGRADVALLLVGAISGHDDAPELQAKIQATPDIDGRITILPACAHPGIWKYFKAADIFAFPSYKEGMPNSLLEAMLAGLPAVAFSIPAVREITRFGNALLEVDAFDFSGFGASLLKLVGDPILRSEIGSRGRDIVQKHFSLETNMRKVADRIKKLVST